MKRLLLERFQEENSILRVRLYHKGRMADTYGLIDTGNGLVDPISKEPVIIIQKSLAEKLLLKEALHFNTKKPHKYQGGRGRKHQITAFCFFSP